MDGRAPDKRTPKAVAAALLAKGFHPVAIYSAAEKPEGKGKAPIGEGWGLQKPTLDSLSDVYRKHRDAGVGICLGPGKAPGGRWLIDVEGDGPKADDSFSTLMGGEVVETIGWTSVRGGHRLLVVEDDFLDFMAAAGGKEIKGKPGVFKLAALPDLEFRIGGTKANGVIKQVQSVCPPTPGTDGEPRTWMPRAELAQIPRSALGTLKAIAERVARERPKSAPRETPRPAPGGGRWSAYVAGAVEREMANVEGAAEGNRNNTLNTAAFNLGQIIGAGELSEGEVSSCLADAARRAGLGEAEAQATIRSGLDAGKALPRVLPEASNGNGHHARNGHHSNGAAVVVPPAPEVAEIEDVEIVDRWPKVDPNVFYGLMGDLAMMADPHTEAAPIATLVQGLAAFGNMIGRTAYFPIGATRHYLTIYPALVGATGVGRKGTAWDVVTWILSQVDPAWADDRIQGGLVSGEGLIHHVRDERFEEQETKDKKTGVKVRELVRVDPGVSDKRLLIVETEMSRMLKAAGRDSNTLSDVIRQAWETGKLRTLGKTNPSKATGAHVSIIAHVTPADVRKYLTETDAANGFANRFLWVLTRRSKELPDGGDIESVNWRPLIARIRAAAEFIAREFHPRLTVEPMAAQLWRDMYSKLTEDRGRNGFFLDRCAPYVRRLSALYAVLDATLVIRVEHLTAALALWDYCEASATLVFGIQKDPNEVKLLTALKAAPEGLTRTEINHGVFLKHIKAPALATLLGDLLTRGVIHFKKVPTAGRPVERWFLGKEDEAS